MPRTDHLPGLAAPTQAPPGRPVVDVRDLHVSFGTRTARTDVVAGVSFTLHPGRCLALVGESGSGKSVTARSLIGLAGPGAHIRADHLRVRGTDVLDAAPRALRALRGADVGLVLQDALVSLDPLRPVGREIADTLRLHGRLSAARRRERVVELLERAGVPQPEQRARQRAGEMSGGLRQRALIAAAIALDPPVLIADEPTTALDAGVQGQILDLLEQVKADGTALLLISHDLAVVERVADTIAVMHHGRIVEQGSPDDVLTRPRHDYTRQLIRAVPAGHPRGTRLSARMSRTGALTLPGTPPELPDAARPDDAPLIEARDLVKHYRDPDGTTRVVVDHVGFALHRGRTLGLVGESGSGKTTTARIVLGLTAPDSGTVELYGQPWSDLPERERRTRRAHIGAVYQDPLGSFDPRLTVRQILVDVLTHGRRKRAAAHDKDVAALLDTVGLPGTVADRRPRHLSGGQRQRVAIARALAPRPRVLVCDEPVSALDVSIQAQILDLLDELQRELGLAYLFISHDLGVVQHVSDTIAVTRHGRIVEHGDAAQVFANPRHPYTRSLLDAAPRLGRGTDTPTRTPA
ncbi:ABC transporter ATP-binding protein [Yinghuangia sp. ASG 101]|uniref:dipeptide ABC transporter ATP-binding protein n=1 Tax=Yinghuangia sp. ASG 101 TaxID=2896848 RepID=UPI001E2ADAF9|nr:ABC transporter ATP-binding protein [Yinghuangia sp. ASG 101]UGQ11971.1 ABC transporter ATP-binding protein [Yinghuangia sp. ASG 101]